jgi:adenine deaminase
MSPGAEPAGLPAPLRESGLEVAERIRTAWGHREPDLLLRGGTVLLGSGEFLRRDVAVVGSRIAVVAEDLSAPGEHVIDVSGKTLVPGYLEPHTHTLGPLSVGSYCGQALVHGTTGVLCDDSFVYGFMPPERYPHLLDVTERMPMVLRWSLRLEPPRTIPVSMIAEMMHRPEVSQLGEVMARPELDDPGPELTGILAEARGLGLRIEGHSPGASPRTLNVVAAAGITADHEALRGEQLIERLRAGLWSFIRYTDMLPHAPAIIADLLRENISFERTGFTTDWSLPPWIARKGLHDAIIAAAMAAGMPADEAYFCASTRPATYFGLDPHIGLVAPGRLASLNVLDDREEPRPRRVFSLGREVARDSELLVEVPEIDWEGLGAPRWTTRTRGPVVDTYRLAADDPEIVLEGSVMINEGRGGHEERPIACVALDDRSDRVTRAALYGVSPDLEGIATTLTPRRLMVAMGADPVAVGRCVDAAIESGGGVAFQRDGEVRCLPLPVGGVLTPAPFADVLGIWEAATELFESLGVDVPDPISTMHYIGSDGLPGVRFTAAGLVETRAKRMIRPAQPISWA